MFSIFFFSWGTDTNFSWLTLRAWQRHLKEEVFFKKKREREDRNFKLIHCKWGIFWEGNWRNFRDFYMNNLERKLFVKVNDMAGVGVRGWGCQLEWKLLNNLQTQRRKRRENSTTIDVDFFLQFPGRRPKRSTSGSQSSLASTPGHSGTSNKRTGSAEWPDPPEAPICSTEDEAASIYSDSGEHVVLWFFVNFLCTNVYFFLYVVSSLIWWKCHSLDEVIPYPTSFLGQGTYVIRKGRKQRQRVPNMEAVSSVNTSRYGRESGGNIELPSPVYPASMLIPNSRHSIDLGSPPPPPPPIMNSLCSPR